MAALNFEICKSFEALTARTYYHTLYEETTRQPMNVTVATLTGQHADLAGKITVGVDNTLAYGRIKIDLLNTIASAPTVERWMTYNYTADGVAKTDGVGRFHIYTKVEQVITAPATLAAHIPSSTNITDVTVQGTGIVETDDFKITFDVTKPLAGEIRIKSGVRVKNVGGATGNYFINVSQIRGDGHIVIEDGVIFDDADGVFSYDQVHTAGGYKGSGYATVGAMSVLSNSHIPEVDDVALSKPQFFLKGKGNPMVPSTFATGMVIEKGYIELDGGATFVTVNGVLSGLRGGVKVNSGCRVTFGKLAINCVYPSATATQVSNIYTVATDGSGWEWLNSSSFLILRGGQWIWRAYSEAGQATNAMRGHIFTMEGYSHSHWDVAGAGKLNGVVMLKTQSLAPLNAQGRVIARAAGLEVIHCLIVGGDDDLYTAPIVEAQEGVTFKYNYNIEYKHRCDRGVTITADGAICPSSNLGVAQNATGTPKRPATTPNRMTECKGNVRFGGTSAGGDTYDPYLVGVTAGVLGEGDLNDTDPQLTNPNYDHGAMFTALVAGTKTLDTAFSELTAACTPRNQTLRGISDSGSDPGPIAVGAASSVRRQRQFIPRASIKRLKRELRKMARRRVRV